MNKEEWRLVVGWEGLYEASNRGRVRSLDRIDSLSRHWKGRVLKQTKGLYYYFVTLRREFPIKLRVNAPVHRLIARAFIGPRPNGKEIRHGVCGQLNNTLENLCYGTHSENAYDRYRDGTASNWAVPVYCSNGETYRSQCEAARQTGVKQSAISMVCKGHRKTAGGYTWRQLT